MIYKHESRSFDQGYKPASVSLPVFAPDLTFSFAQYLTKRGLNVRLAEDNLWFPSRHAGDRIPRIVIPCSTSSGRIYWQARSMIQTKIRYQSPPVKRDDALVITFPNQGIYNALQGYTQKVIIVEGPLDALAVSGVGYTGIGLMGNRPPKVVLDRLVNMFRDTEQDIYLFADSDAISEMSNVMTKLSSEGLRVKLIYRTGYKDAASIPLDDRREIFEKLTKE